MKSIIVDGSCYNFSDDETFINARDSVISSWNKEWQTTPSPTIEISLEDAKKIKELHDVFLIFLKESDPTRYHYIEACYNEKYIKGTVLSEAISKAESKKRIENFIYNDAAKSMDKKGGLNVPTPAIQDQVNELRKKVDDVQTRLSEIASTVSRSNLSQHIRLGGVEPNNL
jgi:hypothetical protein